MMVCKPGTTSAYAENTTRLSCLMCCVRNYLRVRGEYMVGSFSQKVIAELPPRTRRIRGTCHSTLNALGTTSAYAENTFSEEHAPKPLRNYLRVRGEY